MNIMQYITCFNGTSLQVYGIVSQIVGYIVEQSGEPVILIGSRLSVLCV